MKVKVNGWSETPRKVFCIWNWVSRVHTCSQSLSLSRENLHLHAWKNLLHYILRIILLTLVLASYNFVRFSSWLLSPVKNKAIRATFCLPVCSLMSKIFSVHNFNFSQPALSDILITQLFSSWRLLEGGERQPQRVATQCGVDRAFRRQITVRINRT